LTASLVTASFFGSGVGLAEFGSSGDGFSASPVLDFSLVASAAGSAFLSPPVESTTSVLTAATFASVTGPPPNSEASSEI
jgi:hypothetical protein